MLQQQGLGRSSSRSWGDHVARLVSLLGAAAAQPGKGAWGEGCSCRQAVNPSRPGVLTAADEGDPLPLQADAASAPAALLRTYATTQASSWGCL